LDKDHHVFLNLKSLKFYVLPESYQVEDASLSDIQVNYFKLKYKYVVNPTFDRKMIEQLDTQLQISMDLFKKKYHPGFVGLNNIKANDYMSVIVHAFAHIEPIRNYFLDSPVSSFELANRFGLLIRKIWNPKAFKGHVSPHEFMQQVSSDSKKRFTLTKQMDAVEFLSWFMNTLHVELGGNRKPKSSLVHETFQGKVRVETQAIVIVDEDIKRFDLAREIKVMESPFLMLTLDLPPPPLFQDELEKNIIPQVSLTDLLKKYDGTTAQEQGEMLRRCQLLELPPFLIFNIKRLSKNNFRVEKNPTIVNFPLTHLDMAPCKYSYTYHDSCTTFQRSHVL
jgi:U4/U6.U5 tri-snRNP-associated protein 2